MLGISFVIVNDHYLVQNVNPSLKLPRVDSVGHNNPDYWWLMIDDDDGDWWSVWVCVTFFLFILPPRWQTCNIWMKMYIVDFYVFFLFFFQLVLMVFVWFSWFFIIIGWFPDFLIFFFRFVSSFSRFWLVFHVFFYGFCLDPTVFSCFHGFEQ